MDADPEAAAAALAALVRRVAREQLGREPRRVELLEAGLGLRRFARLHFDAPPHTAIARVEAEEDPAGRPPGVPPEPPLEPVRALLERAGLPVPARLGGDADAGVELLEDFGSLSLRDWAPTAAAPARRALYARACALVPRLQRIADAGGVAAFARRLDDAHFAYKAELFADWCLDGATPAEREAVRASFAHVAEVAARAPRRLAHRDLQSANLMLRPGTGDPPALGLIDLQGALLAPPEYDLVCLLRDSYVELPDDEVAALAEHTRAELPDAPGREIFAQRFDLLTLTRKGKDCARFRYAARARGDGRYLACIPATLRALRAAATRAARREPALAALAELIHALPEPPCAP